MLAERFTSELLLVQINCFDVPSHTHGHRVAFRINSMVLWWHESIERRNLSIFYVSMAMRMWFGATHSIQVNPWSVAAVDHHQNAQHFHFFLFGSDREVDWYTLSKRYYGLERGPMVRNAVCSKMTYLIFWRHSFMLIKMKSSVQFHCHWNARRMQFESRIINAPSVFI